MQRPCRDGVGCSHRFARGRIPCSENSVKALHEPFEVGLAGERPEQPNRRSDLLDLSRVAVSLAEKPDEASSPAGTEDLKLAPFLQAHIDVIDLFGVNGIERPCSTQLGLHVDGAREAPADEAEHVGDDEQS